MSILQKLVFILPPSLGFIGMTLFIIGYIKYPVLNTSSFIWISILIILPFDLLYIGISASILKEFKQYMGIILILTILFFSWAAPGTILFINGFYDTANVEKHNAIVLEKSYSTSAKGTGRVYYVKVNSWHNKTKKLKIEVSADTYEKSISNKSEVLFITSKGYLGFERMISNSIKK